MSQPKHIHVNAFNMNCVGHIHHGLWTHPRDRSTEYHTLKYWTDIARILEKGLFDALFIADVIGYYDVYQQGVDLTLREGIQLPVNNPWLLVSAMAAVTEHLGFGVTATVSAEHPYTFARDVTTLDQLSNGRIGWNIVTGYVDSGARGLGRDSLDEHDTRYDRADDFLALAYKLWEGSWEDGAVIADKARRIHALPDKVHAVQHEGPYYRANAIHMSAPSPQRTPLLFQAGTSERGRRFAGQHAEGIFIGARDPAAARASSRQLRQAAIDAGRAADDVKIYAGVAVVTGRTEAEAREKYEDYLAHANPEGGLAHFAASTGIDFAQYDLDEPIAYGNSNAIQSAGQAAQQAGLSTRRQLLEQFKLGSRYNTIVGTPAQVADRLTQWIDEGEIDGFNLTRIVVPETWEDFAELVVPELQDRGRYKTAHGEGTLRQQLFGHGDRLPARHPAAQWRRS
ncbi:LLM class flavin-dependent oxidoreductase [Corticibacter populi]|uniref:LLM class flavin-dependent oxidoreductase n=1 Tax=Corticibacter populi TaxID=1550736 RepID=A0A3M6QXK3_9BURK|nr:LLM class flavin-dependent oxidoreductase [Corticibacter populi]RMX07704.1 LLM class flavin-dependent oxidoreductase [Corticibacter populi]RZS30219.1 FMN-dependent oxidoreductase (nitrilotriacetate monooxygenase family) [Corticibacter populi]